MKIKSLIMAAVCALFVVSVTAPVFAQGTTPAPAPTEEKKPMKKKMAKKPMKKKMAKKEAAPAPAAPAPAK